MLRVIILNLTISLKTIGTLIGNNVIEILNMAQIKKSTIDLLQTE